MVLAVFDIGGTRIRAALSPAPGQLGPVSEVPTPRDDLGVFTAQLRAMAAGAQGVAISIAGCIDPDNGRMRIANIPCLDGTAPGKVLAQALDLPVWIGNDADCFALAEAGSGAGRGHRTVFGVILGTGVGGGLVIDGQLLTGAGGFAGEWGHGPVQQTRVLGREVPGFRCGCGQVGCLDAVGSARGIERLHRHLSGAAATAEVIIAAWQAGDAAAVQTVAVWLEIMAGPLAMVLNVVGATRVPMGGGLGRATALVAALEAAVRARRLWAGQGVIVPAELAVEPGLIGASHGGWRAQGRVPAQGGIAVLRGNLAPNGAVIKPSAATPALIVHRGRAVVFGDIDDCKARIGDEDLDIDEACVMVLKNCGPKGYPGMAEVGSMGLPPKVLRRGITDMVRISDARMSGTAYGTVVLHTAPEAAAGGPLAVVRDGDMIELDVPNRRLHLDIPADELAARLAAWQPPPDPAASGYAWLHQAHVGGADTGADLGFLRGSRGRDVGRDSH